MGGRFKKEGTYVYLWLICVDVWQKPIQCCKEIILQLKKLFKKKKMLPQYNFFFNITFKKYILMECSYLWQTVIYKEEIETTQNSS